MGIVDTLLGAPRRSILSAYENLSDRNRTRILWLGRPPRNDWHSWDSKPWRHPWLTPDNLRAIKAFSVKTLAAAAEARRRARPGPYRFAFVGNLANNLYMRAVPLRKAGARVSVFLHPQDNYVMSQPGWEHYEGELPGGVTDIRELRRLGVQLPEPEDVYQFPDVAADLAAMAPSLDFLPLPDILRYATYIGFRDTLQALRGYDALLAVQAPYLAYLSARPYAVTQMGGDIWYEASRDDLYGRLQRRSFAAASVFLASNPWSFSHARRFGFRHMVYVPIILDEESYSPGTSPYRDKWAKETGGTFFALSTARQDEFYKGSSVALEGFARFSRSAPGARLALAGWGADLEKLGPKLQELGIRDKTFVIPVAGKRRLVEYLRAADCLLDQFVLGYFGATGLEAMACGLPVIMRLERAQYDALCETGAPPVLDAATSEEVAAHLQRLYGDHGFKAALGREHRDWLVANHSGARWRETYLDILIAVANGFRFRFGDSPLAAPLSAAEREYHAAELARAPRFPSYS